MTTGTDLARELCSPASGLVRASLLGSLDRHRDVLRARNVPQSPELLWAREALLRTLSLGRIGRVAAVGRRGAGKSSLANALSDREIFEVGDVRDRTRAPEVLTVPLGARRVEWIDTPGLRAAGEPGRAEHVAERLAAVMPDVLLMLCQASEVDAGIDDDLRDLRAIARAVERASGRGVPVLAVVTKVDELSPPDVLASPYDDEKRANIRRAVTVLHRHLLGHGVVPWAVIPVATYVERRGDRVCLDGRWNLDPLRARLSAMTAAAVIHHPARLADEYDRMRDGYVAALIEAFALRAHALGSGPWTLDQRREIAALETCLVALLEGLFQAPDDPAGTVRASASARGAARLLEAARAGVTGLRAWRISGALAAGRLRVLGQNVAAALKRR